MRLMEFSSLTVMSTENLELKYEQKFYLSNYVRITQLVVC